MSKEINYGPLQALIGEWQGDKGVDIAPEPDGDDTNLFYETIKITPAGDVDNAEKQELVMVHYHQIVRRKRNDEVFHNETGFWIWDKKSGEVMQSFTIPRGVCVLAGGSNDGSISNETKTELNVAAKDGDENWGVLQSPFMQKNARTLSFEHQVSVDGDKMTYSETTVVDIYGRLFNHKDSNELVKLK